MIKSDFKECCVHIETW